MRLPGIGVVAPRDARDLARGVVVERLGQVVRRARSIEVVGQRRQPRRRIITKALHRPVAIGHARSAADSELRGSCTCHRNYRNQLRGYCTCHGNGEAMVV